LYTGGNKLANSSGKTVCVTGASGYIASHVISLLAKQGFKIIGTVRNTTESKLCHLDEYVKSGVLKIVQVDYHSPEALEGVFSESQHVINTTTSYKRNLKNVSGYISENLLSTDNILHACKTTNIKTLIHISSGNLHCDKDGNNLSEPSMRDNDAYKYSKIKSEKNLWDAYNSLSDCQLRLVVIVPTLVLGPILNSLHVATSVSFLRELLKMRKIGTVNMVVNTVDVRDLAFMISNAVTRDDSHGRYVVTHEIMTTRKIRDEINKHFSELYIRNLVIPNWIVIVFAKILYGRSLKDTKKRLLNRPTEVDVNHTNSDLGFPRISASKTIVDTIRSFQKHRILN
jgi:nucleoside-diphosphate-sugar epimerase